MDPTLFFILLGIGFAVYLFYHMRKSYGDGYRRGQAEAAAKGNKPWGKPMQFQFGSAYIMMPNQIIEAGAGLPPGDLQQKMGSGNCDALLLGHIAYKQQQAAVTFNDAGHVLTTAPTRSGKGVSAVIPNLLHYSGSVVVNDIKGENAAVTAKRRQAMGQNVQILAPFADDELAGIGKGKWNPFDMLADSTDPWEDARYMAELLVPDEPGKDEFWGNSARNFLTGLIVHIHLDLPEADRTLGSVRGLLTQGKEEFEKMLAEMGTSKNTVVRRASDVLSRADDKVRENVLSTLDSHLGFLDSERLVNDTGQSTFSFKDLKNSNTTIYLVLPPDRLRMTAPFVRLFFGMAALELKRSSKKPDTPVLFMLDEFPALGRMKLVEEEIAFLAGYGVNLWLFAQDLKQLAVIYGDKAHSIISNCAVKQFFGVSDMETAQLVSLMSGETTIPTISYTNDRGLIINDGSMNLASGTRPLFTPNEVTSADPENQMIFFRGQQVIVARKFNYLREDIFAPNGTPLFSENPFH